MTWSPYAGNRFNFLTKLLVLLLLKEKDLSYSDSSIAKSANLRLRFILFAEGASPEREPLLACPKVNGSTVRRAGASLFGSLLVPYGD